MKVPGAKKNIGLFGGADAGTYTTSMLWAWILGLILTGTGFGIAGIYFVLCVARREGDF